MKTETTAPSVPLCATSKVNASARRKIGKGFICGLAASALLSLLPTTGYTQTSTAQNAIRIGLNNSPPLAFVREDGSLEGMLVERASLLFTKLGMRAEMGVYPAPRLFNALQEGSLDFSLLVHAPALDICCLLSKAPVMTHVLRVYWMGDTPTVRSREDLSDKSIIMLLGYSYAGLANQVTDPKNRNRVEIAKTFDAAFQMLESGRAGYLLAYEANTQKLLSSRTIPQLKSEVIGKYPVHMVLSRNFPDAASTLQRLEELQKTIQAP